MEVRDAEFAEYLKAKGEALVAQTQRRQEVIPIFSFDLLLYYDEGVLNYTSEIIYERKQSAEAAANEIVGKIGHLLGKVNSVEVRVQEGCVVRTVYRNKLDFEINNNERQ